MTLRWLGCCALIAAAAVLPCASSAHEGEGASGAPGDVQALVARAEAALASGDAQQALATFEQAAARWHAAPIEAGWVRAQMQAGEYGRALAFAAHVAGAHPEDPAGTLLYGWLLYLGAQPGQAQRLLVDGLRRWPADADLRRLAHRLAGGAADDLPEPTRLRLAPYATGDLAPSGATSAGSALLWSPDTALVPPGIGRHAGALWLRDGLGRTRTVVDRRWEPLLGLWVVRLSAPFGDPLPAAVRRDVFPGGVLFSAGYAPGAGQPQWPRLTLGFAGMPAQEGQRHLGFVPPDTTGGAVFNAAGQLAGIVMPAVPGGAPVYLPWGRLHAVLGARGSADEPVLVAAGDQPGGPAAPPASAEAAYSAALRLTLQCLYVPGAVLP